MNDEQIKQVVREEVREIEREFWEDEVCTLKAAGIAAIIMLPVMVGFFFLAEWLWPGFIERINELAKWL